MLDLFVFLEKISTELSERHLHHKIKRHMLHISNLDKINMCLEIVKSDRCNTIIVAYCLQVINDSSMIKPGLILVV